MKKPREILMERHQGIEPQLDALRRQVLQTTGRTERPALDLAAGLALLWQQLVLPCRRVWAGLGLAWVAILLLHAATGSPQVAPLPPLHPLTSDSRAELREQWLLRLELLGVAAASTPQRPPAPAPHSEAMPGRSTARRQVGAEIV